MSPRTVFELPVQIDHDSTIGVSIVNYWDPTWFQLDTDLLATLRAQFKAKQWSANERHVIDTDTSSSCPAIANAISRSASPTR